MTSDAAIAISSERPPDYAALARLRESAGWESLPADVLSQQTAGSRWFVTAWDGERLIGFVRAISDGVSNAYICGMVVDEAYRRRGIGQRMVAALINPHPSIRWVLHSRSEVDGFYRSCGFAPADGMFRRDRARRLSSL